LISERILSIDLSSKSGWCFAWCTSDNLILQDYGQIPKIEQPDETYPGAFVSWAYLIFNKVEELIERFQPEVLVIEETCGGSKNAMSQKILEFGHFLLAKFIQETGIKHIYLMTGEWRKEIGSYMNSAEKQRNKEIKEYKKKHNTVLARDRVTGKVVGRVDKKKVTIRLINDIFKDSLRKPLGPSEDDTADAIGLAYCYHLRRKRGMYV
jgi:Holliday junction resolvasome RuvABC endonuclease subunit